MYDSQDKMLSYGQVQYIYTANGEWNKKIVGVDTTHNTYDNFGNLTKVIFANGDVIEYIIDGQNRRIAKKLNGNFVRRWIYSGQLSPVAEIDSTGNVVSRFVGSYFVKAGVTYRLITDHLGSVRLVVNTSTGVVAQRIDYDEFGNVISDSNPGFQPFAYAGGLYDTQTKLVRFGARDYDAKTGRWTTKDPIGFIGGINFYNYALQDPINKYDKTGLKCPGDDDPKPYSAEWYKALLEAAGIIGEAADIAVQSLILAGKAGQGLTTVGEVLPYVNLALNAAQVYSAMQEGDNLGIAYSGGEAAIAIATLGVSAAGAPEVAYVITLVHIGSKFYIMYSTQDGTVPEPTGFGGGGASGEW